MEKVKSFFDSFKEFVWDIIGYLLPGSYILILLSTCINSNYFVYPSLGIDTKEYSSFIFIICSYILGFVAYGLGLLKESFLGKYSYKNQIESDFAMNKNFIITKKHYVNALSAKGIVEDMSNVTIREWRNIAMSFNPEQDQKIYTFIFRSDLSNQSANISILVGVLGVLSKLFCGLPFGLFKTDNKYVIIYLCLIVSYFLLRLTRNKFYKTSFELPFFIYSANASK